MDLKHALVEPIGDLRHARYLERTGGHHHLVGLAGAVVQLHEVCLAAPANRSHAAIELQREVEVAGVVGEVGHHLVAVGIVKWLARKGKPRKRVVAGRREEPQRVPAAPPGGCGLACSLEDREIAALPGQEVPHGQAGLATADDDYLVVPAHEVRQRVANAETDCFKIYPLGQ